MNPTRYAIAKNGLEAAVADHTSSYMRWGLVKLRQANPQWRVSPNCEKPVRVTDATQINFGDETPCDGGTKKFGIYAPSVGASELFTTSAARLDPGSAGRRDGHQRTEHRQEDLRR